VNVYDYYITPEEYEIAAKNGICRKTLEKRIRELGWDKERAISEKPRKKSSIKKLAEIAKKNGINYHTFHYRIRNGWEIERAVSAPLVDKKKLAAHASESKRKYPKDVVEMARKNGISYTCFVKRVYNGMDLIEAATKPTMTPHERALKAKVSIQRLFLRKTI